MSGKTQLDEYREKRDFRKTTEPRGDKELSPKGPVFVIQKHAARKLHYDFRLEANGVLKSWAVPKGPSTDPSEKRLAVPTEDHPLDYADFEGVIPHGEYGAGTVLVWDTGPYMNLKEEDGKEVSLEQCIEEGHVTVVLAGKKLRGGYALIRTGRKHDERWLLIKMNDNYADAGRDPVNAEPNSVLTGRSLEEIREQES